MFSVIVHDYQRTQEKRRSNGKKGMNQRKEKRGGIQTTSVKKSVDLRCNAPSHFICSTSYFSQFQKVAFLDLKTLKLTYNKVNIHINIQTLIYHFILVWI